MLGAWNLPFLSVLELIEGGALTVRQGTAQRNRQTQNMKQLAPVPCPSVHSVVERFFRLNNRAVEPRTTRTYTEEEDLLRFRGPLSMSPARKCTRLAAWLFPASRSG